MNKMLHTLKDKYAVYIFISIMYLYIICKCNIENFKVLIILHGYITPFLLGSW